MIVYFDRNVFADLCEFRRGVTIDDVNLLQKAVDSCFIEIPLSVTLLEETIRLIDESTKDYRSQLQTLSRLVNKRRMLRLPFELLDSACFCYSIDFPQQTPFIKPPQYFRDILDLSKQRDELLEVSQKILAEQDSSANRLIENIGRAKIDDDERKIVKELSFYEYWKFNAESFVKSLLSTQPGPIREYCERLGLKPMLEIKSIRLYSIYYCWLIYSSVFGDQGNRRKPKRSDIGDMFHAINSAAAQIFVSQESKQKTGKISNILSKVPIRDYQILNLDEFLQYLRNQ